MLQLKGIEMKMVQIPVMRRTRDARADSERQRNHQEMLDTNKHTRQHHQSKSDDQLLAAILFESSETHLPR